MDCSGGSRRTEERFFRRLDWLREYFLGAADVKDFE